MPLSLRVTGLPRKDQAFNNRVYMSPNTFSQAFVPMSNIQPLVQIGSYVYSAESHGGVGDGEVGMNSLQRLACQLQMEEATVVTAFAPSTETTLATATFSVDLLVKKKSSDGKPNRNVKEIDADELLAFFRSVHEGQCFRKQQKIAIDFEGTKYEQAS